MEMEQVRTEAAGETAGTEPVAAEPTADGTVEPAVDRDRLALEALEGELAVLEDELARVDAERGDRAPGEHR